MLAVCVHALISVGLFATWIVDLSTHSPEGVNSHALHLQCSNSLVDHPVYVAIPSGTCESAGHTPLGTKSECIAALDLGYQQSWGPHGGYSDVVDGCSVRFGDNLFLNQPGICHAGSTTPGWIPDLNGVADCQCSAYQPCLCQASGGCATPQQGRSGCR